ADVVEQLREAALKLDELHERVELNDIVIGAAMHDLRTIARALGTNEVLEEPEAVAGPALLAIEALRERAEELDQLSESLAKFIAEAWDAVGRAWAGPSLADAIRAKTARLEQLFPCQ